MKINFDVKKLRCAILIFFFGKYCIKNNFMIFSKNKIKLIKENVKLHQNNFLALNCLITFFY